MKKRNESLISGLLIAAVLVVAANAWLAFRVEDVLAGAESWVVHSWQTINAVQQSINSVGQMESEERGFLITKDPAYLAPYYAAVANLRRNLAYFDSLSEDNPRQQQRVQIMQTLVNQRVAILTKSIDLQEGGHRGQALALLRQGAGRAEMSSLRQIVIDMQAEEYDLLRDRQRASARARFEARFAVGLASGFNILFIVFALWSLGRERRLRERSNEVADRLQKLQTISDVAITQLTFAELTTELLHRVQIVADADAVALYSYHANGSDERPEAQVEVLAARGVDLVPGSSFSLMPGGPFDRVRQQDRSVTLTGAEVGEMPIGEFTHAMGTLLILPLTVAGVMIGILVAGQKHENAFSARDEDLLHVVADRMAVAIDRASLFESEQEARRNAEASAAEIQELNAVLEDRVQQRTAELEATNRELEAFSYSVSHDLRAPLRSVDGFSVALTEDYGALLEGDGKHYLGRIRAGVQRMGQLIDALLQLSRITRAEISVESVDLSALAGSVAEELAQTYPERNIHFTIEPGLKAECDPRLLRTVFENMFGNAAKFTSKVPEARIGFAWSPERSAYSIFDNGAGFDQQYAGKLFVAFQRLHGDKDFQGSGIGLATVARVIHRHHGTLWAEGKVGEGATFWFTLSTGSL